MTRLRVRPGPVYAALLLAVAVATLLFSPPSRSDAVGPRGDVVGLVDPAAGLWHIYDHSGDLENWFFYGNPGDLPFLGDWDCDGIDTPGLFRPADAFAYLRNSNTPGIADIRFFFGNPDDVPLAGDFNGDGCDTLSIYRPSTGRIYIVNRLGQNEGGLGAADFDFGFGDLGDKPVVGDWDGDGIDEVGLHRESTGQFYWRNSLTTGVADGSITFGDPGDRFVAGDWGVVDGRDTPSVFRPGNAMVFHRFALASGTADNQFAAGEPDWVPIAGSVPKPDSPPPTSTTTTVPPPTTANYTVTFNATWSAATHPISFPPGPHFSGLVGGAHGAAVSFWETGEPASSGIEQMAERGAKTALLAEVRAAISAGTAGSVISGGGIGRSPGTATAGVAVTRDHPLATVVAMIAPSPDWFVGVSGLNLFENNAWVQQKVVDLLPYDAGTDSGSTYTSPDAATNPAEPITVITTLPVGNGRPLGQFVFTLASTSS